jgi:adenosine kinase
VDAFPIQQIVDPTWCGDAYRGGLLRGLRHAFDWAHAMQVGSYMASLCIQSEGTMEHAL